MKKLAVFVVCSFFAGVLTSAGMIANGGNGKAIFVQNKCVKCHSIESQGLKRDGEPPAGGKIPPDLSTVGTKHDANWMTKWLLKEEEQNGKKHLKKFGGSEDDLKTLTGWLAGLKKK